MTSQAKKVGLIAGGGILPKLIIEALKAEGTPYHVVTFKGQPQPECELSKENQTEVKLGAVGKVVNTFKKHNVTHVVMGGFLKKPSLFDIRPDLMGVKILASLVSKNDDALLSAICKFFEKQGFGVLGAHSIVPSLVATEGAFGKIKPSAEQLNDINMGIKAARTLGELDIGQAAIVKDGVVLGVEGAEGTDGLIERCASLRGKKNKGGILVKCAKPHQNLDVDMPSIGVETIEKLGKLGYDGVAVLAGSTLVLDATSVVKEADKKTVFVFGVGAIR